MQDTNVLQAQIDELERSVQAAEAELFSRESELLDLRTELIALERQYEARIGTGLAELEAVEAETRACQKQLDEVRIWGAGGAQRRFGAQYVSVGEQYRQTWQEKTSGFSFSSFADRLVERLLSPEDEAQLKTLYRQLCRRFHPDLARDESERVCRTEMMAKINAAHTARDLQALESLSVQPDCDAIAETVVSLRDTLQRIRQRLQAVEREMDGLVHSDFVALSVDIKLARRQGRDLWAEMEADVEQALVEKRAELASLRTQLRAFGTG
jgi:hypothetical protein